MSRNAALDRAGSRLRAYWLGVAALVMVQTAAYLVVARAVGMGV